MLLRKQSEKIAKLRDRLEKKKIPYVFDNRYSCDYNIVYPYDSHRKYKVCLSYGDITIIEYNEETHQEQYKTCFMNIEDCYKMIRSDWRKNKRRYRRIKNVF